MNAETLRALAERVMAATGPDRELDAAIASLCGWGDNITPLNTGGKMHSSRDPEGRTLPGGLMVNAPVYTTSLDAAITLVPEGWALTLLGEARRGRHHVTLVERDQTLHRSAVADAATPALALTAAALLARAAMEEANG